MSTPKVEMRDGKVVFVDDPPAVVPEAVPAPDPVPESVPAAPVVKARTGKKK